MIYGMVRDLFLSHSGRYDLGTLSTGDGSDGADSTHPKSADFYVNAGMKMLERMFDWPRAKKRYFNELAADAWYDKFQLCRSIKEVWINNTSGRSELTKKDIVWLRNEYTGLISATDSGTPLYYAPAVLDAVDSGDMDNHLAIGDGIFDFTGLFFYLREHDHRPIITLEPHQEDDLWGSLSSLSKMKLPNPAKS